MKKLMLVLSVACLAGCYNDSKQELYPAVNNPIPGGCDTANVTYSAKVQPIFTANCATSGCHDATTKSSGYDLSSYSGAKAAVDGGRLLGAINHAAGFSQMPQGKPKLDDCKIATIAKWANTGAKND